MAMSWEWTRNIQQRVHDRGAERAAAGSVQAFDVSEQFGDRTQRGLAGVLGHHRVEPPAVPH